MVTNFESSQRPYEEAGYASVAHLLERSADGIPVRVLSDPWATDPALVISRAVAGHAAITKALGLPAAPVSVALSERIVHPDDSAPGFLETGQSSGSASRHR